MNNTLGLPVRRSRKLSLTALIDVVFILLMFFMITSSFSQWRSLDLTTQAAATAAAPSEPAPVLILQDSGDLLMVKGELRLRDTTSADRLGPDLLNALGSEATVTLVAEPEVTIDRIIALIARLNRQGISNVSLGDALPEPLPDDVWVP